MRAGVAQGGSNLSCALQFVCERHSNAFPLIELAQYADDTALEATSKHPALLVKYLETHLSELEIWIREWRVTINVGKSAAVLFTTRRMPLPPPLIFLGEEIR